MATINERLLAFFMGWMLTTWPPSVSQNWLRESSIKAFKITTQFDAVQLSCLSVGVDGCGCLVDVEQVLGYSLLLPEEPSWVPHWLGDFLDHDVCLDYATGTWLFWFDRDGQTETAFNAMPKDEKGSGFSHFGR